MVREVAILTMSSKNGGYCVAGIDLENGEWIRLVSDDMHTHGALTNKDIAYSDGGHCKPLDVVSVATIDQYTPIERQPENALIDSTENWEKVGTTDIENVLEIHPAEYHDVLLGNRYSYITEHRINEVRESLILVKVSDLTINHLTINHPPEQSTNHPPERYTKTKATFTYRGTEYSNMSVTDPEYYTVPDNYHINRAILVMSLPDSPHNGKYYYKFVAKIFPL